MTGYEACRKVGIMSSKNYFIGALDEKIVIGDKCIFREVKKTGKINFGKLEKINGEVITLKTDKGEIVDIDLKVGSCWKSKEFSFNCGI